MDPPHLRSSVPQSPELVPQAGLNANARSPPRPIRPVFKRFYSLPELPTISPVRHHMRIPNAEPRTVKHTPSITVARDAAGQRINEYLLKECVGRGSYGPVYRALDANNQEWAIKEYAKSQLVKANQRALMQRRRQGIPWSGRASELIAAEIAIMKRIDHPNLVDLHEVLEDDDSDRLYMVLEWCENGTVMPSDPSEVGEPHLDEEQCRLYFRDMILSVEYLHAHGIVHRDIKADNCLLGEGDVLKLADFGVSEIFEGPEEDTVRSTAGSPAYWAPELARLAGATDDGLLAPQQLKKVSGRKTDVWAMGVTLWYMFFGRLPFEAQTLHEMYTKILKMPPQHPSECPPDLADCLKQMLEKNPEERISLRNLRRHPWVTKRGKDVLLPYEENIADGNSGDGGVITEAQLLSAIEHIRQIHPDQAEIDVAQAARSLRRDLGWRGGIPITVSGASTPRRGAGTTYPSENTGTELLRTTSLDEGQTLLARQASPAADDFGLMEAPQIPDNNRLSPVPMVVVEVPKADPTHTTNRVYPLDKAQYRSAEGELSDDSGSHCDPGDACVDDGVNVAKLTKALDEIVRKLRWSSVG